MCIGIRMCSFICICICMYVCIYAHIDTYVCTWKSKCKKYDVNENVNVYVSVCVSEPAHVHAHVSCICIQVFAFVLVCFQPAYVYVYVYVHVYVFAYVHVYLHVHVHVFVYVRVCICIIIYTRRHMRSTCLWSMFFALHIGCPLTADANLCEQHMSSALSFSTSLTENGEIPKRASYKRTLSRSVHRQYSEPLVSYIKKCRKGQNRTSIQNPGSVLSP